MAGGGSSSTDQSQDWQKAAGITIAIVGSFLTGLAFVLQKKAHMAGDEMDPTSNEYLKSPVWWAGMLSLGIGEVCNFAAYAFQPAIVVAPLGALSVAVSAVLSALVLKEKLSFSGSVGISQCIFGSVIIVLYAPASNTTKTVDEFFSYVLQPGFIVYSIICAGVTIYLVYFAAKKYGQQHPAVFISVVAIVGSYLVLSAQGFGSSLVYTISDPTNNNQFTNWAIYPLMAFVGACAFSQIIFLNKALNCFSPSVVAPINYVFFTTMTILSSAVLFRGFNVESVTNGISMLIGFLVIVGGVSLLFQYSLNLNKLRLLSNVVEDIDDADDAQSIDENPIKILNEGISLARRESTQSETAIRGVILPDRELNESTETFRRHSLEPVSSFRPKDKTDAIIDPPKAFNPENMETRPPRPVLSTFSSIPEMTETQISSSESILAPAFNSNSIVGKSLSASSEISKEPSISNSEEAMNQLLRANSILGMPAKFGNMEDNLSNEELEKIEPLRKQPEMIKRKSTDHVISMDLSSSSKNEDWMW